MPSHPRCGVPTPTCQETTSCATGLRCGGACCILPCHVFGQPETTPWQFFLILGGGRCKGNWLLLLRTLSAIVGLSLVAGHLLLVNAMLICFAGPCSPLQPFFLLSLTDVGQEAAEELAQIQDGDLASSTGDAAAQPRVAHPLKKNGLVHNTWCQAGLGSCMLPLARACCLCAEPSLSSSLLSCSALYRQAEVITTRYT